MSENKEDKWSSVKIWVYRGMLKVQWTDRLRNEAKAETHGTVITGTYEASPTWGGHDSSRARFS